MKITETKIKKIIEKYLPEYSDVEIIVEEKRTLFSVMPISRKMICPHSFFMHTNGYSLYLSLLSAVFHEIGHVATIKDFPRTDAELIKAEGDAQKWAIEKAIELGQIKLTRCLLKRFTIWKTSKMSGFRGELDKIYQNINPYKMAAIENEKWIEEKLNLIAA